jgi:hypothetical protein
MYGKPFLEMVDDFPRYRLVELNKNVKSAVAVHYQQIIIAMQQNGKDH